MKTIIIIANLILTLVFGACSSKEQDSQGQTQAATIRKSSATLNASHKIVLPNVKDLYFKAQSARHQHESYSTVTLTTAQQSLKATMTAYQSGRTDFLMLVDAYRLVELSMESLMVQMHFKPQVSELERQVGVPDIVSK